MIFLLLFLLLLIVAFGGVFVSHWIWILIIFLVVLAFVGPVEGGGWGRRRW